MPFLEKKRAGGLSALENHWEAYGMWGSGLVIIIGQAAAFPVPDLVLLVSCQR